MKLVQTQPVEIALRTLDPEDRRQVLGWFHLLKNWENDPFVREHSHPLASADGVYMLRTSSDIRIFFKLEQDQIVVLDIAKQATLMRFAHMSGSGQP
jgi:hypothetical protein